MEALSRQPGGRHRPGWYTARIKAMQPLSAGACEIALPRPDGFRFAAGQWLTVHHAGDTRDYSMVSAPQDEELRLCIRIVPGGRMSAAIAGSPPGTVLSFSGPHGYFTFKPSTRPAVFVATGVGIAPFCSMAAFGIRGFVLLHGVKKSIDLLYRAQVAAGAARYVPCLSGERPASPEHFGGRVTDFLRAELPPGDHDFYLCGRQDMVRDAMRVIDRRFGGSRVYSEVFY